MGSKGSPEYRALRRERERLRRKAAERSVATGDRRSAGAATARAAAAPARRVAATVCGWCGGPIKRRSRGPIPQWCSDACRHRAWEQARAAASGRSAVEVVERHVQVIVLDSPGRREWPRVLEELAHQLDDGRVYDRDLSGLAAVLERVLAAYRRRAEGFPGPYG